MGPTWVLSAPDGPHVGPVNLAVRDYQPYMKFEIHADFDVQGLYLNSLPANVEINAKGR